MLTKNTTAVVPRTNRVRRVSLVKYLPKYLTNYPNYVTRTCNKLMSDLTLDDLFSTPLFFLSNKFTAAILSQLVY